ncbi:unnamed protein product [Zymoseptoria tritici ST99CH_3D7]|uniref:Kinesin motor domain-containing protein n=1 Tax=Zymoseptoria tritici (strain ST99CH_3D7) TaxID=1276538 RepID=A0A1X7S3T3_ZYMT9|nr:unnamed protein product [Zymoseptoria tritici ST99CH_3D7]
MRPHNRTQSRMAEVASRSSDEESARTAVKVVVRIRPPLKAEDPGFDLIPQRFRESTCEVPNSHTLHIQSPQKKEEFIFDRIFDENTTQEGLWEYLSDSVTSFVKGYNVSILAYGQSGSGKSYTMGTSGPEDQADPEVKGVVPRAAQALFEALNGSSSRPSGLQTPKRYSVQNMPSIAGVARGGNASSKSWELRATYVEIYNEQFRDLLVPEAVPQHERGQVLVREDAKGRIMLTGLTQLPINSAEDVLNALNFGSTIRQTDATAINARSSRSHAVFSLNLIQKKADGRSAPLTKAEKHRSMPTDDVPGAENIVTLDSKLHFVDLAGSERLKNTGATGERAKEGIAINAGLASLGKVISQLSTKQGSGHISYRDAKLTRLLQDSLGGNAITFMVACVTPAAFHLSETLNTVHYAYRARSIQSKPTIQQSHEDGDKQAVIDRLRAEVSFLRDQIRHNEYNAGRNNDKGERTDRPRGRETELQSQLLDMRENYNALSGRHAKLISEISKSRDNEEAETPLLNEAIGEHASERIKRSNSFAEAVEQVVLEYEKTIQSLETSLSKTRSSLASTESTLLEKETRIAYLDTIQQQLQARVAKYMEREADNDSYTRTLEEKMHGATTDEERNATLISELRKEVARARDSEVGAEEYISTLEERLAEAEQDHEMMQREIDRLEHVVERQRSIGRLDNILTELDGGHDGEAKVNGDSHLPQAVHAAANGHIRDSVRSSAHTRYSSDGSDYMERDISQPTPETIPSSITEAPRSPAQAEFMAEKLESLTQEFFDLRSEHENVLTDYDLLQQKYRTALETLAKMEYDKDVPKSPTLESDRDSFLAGAGMEVEEKATNGQQPTSSRSLSSELSSQEPQNTGAEAKEENKLEDGQIVEQHFTSQSDRDSTPGRSPVEQDVILQEMETLRKLHAEKEVSVTELTKNYMSLAQRHEATLSQVESLKQEVQKSQQARAASPTVPASPSTFPKSWRRRSEELLSNSSDRAARSYVTLKTLVLNNFEDQADVRHTFEQNLNNVMAELHSRSERVQALEAEIGTVKKEMDTKQTIIAGLTRERSSMAASSAVDFSVVGQMRDQLMESENQIRALHEQHAAREKELQEQVESLKTSLDDHQKANAESLSVQDRDVMPGDFPATPSFTAGSANKEITEEQAMAGAAQSNDSEEVARLQEQVATWEGKHREAVDSMNVSQEKLMATISELQGSLRAAEDKGASREAESSDGVSAALEEQRVKHQEMVDALTAEVEKHRSLADEHVSKLDELQKSYDAVRREAEDHSQSREQAQTDLSTHKDLVANLENQLQMHKSAIAIHQESLETLQSSHTKEIEELQQSMANLENETAAKHDALEDSYEAVVTELEKELEDAKSQAKNLLLSASAALGYETSATALQSQIEGLVEEGKDLHTRHLKTTNELKDVQEELQSAINRSVELESQIGELKTVSEERAEKLEKMTEKYNKSSTLCEQLEEQLNSTYDTHQATTNRLSTLQSESGQARVELERELEEAKFRSAHLEQQLNAFKHLSMASNGSSTAINRDSLSPEVNSTAPARSSSAGAQRKTGGGVLPTPPPSIPLPPLPPLGTPTAGSFDGPTSPTPRGRSPHPAATSPPGSAHGSTDIPPSPAVMQLIEEQETRIRTIEKHLFAEKQLTATLEEALVDLETSANRTKSEMENWRKKCTELEDELVGLRKERTNSRASVQAVEEEREMRRRAETARLALEQRMAELNANKKKKKSGLNCF